ARYLALSPLHLELQRCRGTARRTRIDVSHETIRRWVTVFGPMIARRLRAMRPKPHTAWHLDEMFVSIGGNRRYLWRAVDAEGEVLDCLLQSRRNKRAALRLMRKLIRKYRMVPAAFVTDRCLHTRQQEPNCRYPSRTREACDRTTGQKARTFR